MTVHITRGPLPEDQRQKIVRLYTEDKLPMLSIRQRTGVSHERIREALREAGVQMERRRVGW